MFVWLMGVAILVGVYLLFFRRARQLIARQGREDFSHNVRALLMAWGSGGTMEVSVRGLDVRFEVIKLDVLNDSATIMIRLPRASWSVLKLEAVLKTFANSDYEVSKVTAETSPALLELRVQVDDIWEEWSGARSARAIHLLLDALSVPEDSKFDLHMSGPFSWKWVAREWRKT